MRKPGLHGDDYVDTLPGVAYSYSTLHLKDLLGPVMTVKKKKTPLYICKSSRAETCYNVGKREMQA